MKIVILLMIAVVLYCLGSGLYYLVNMKSNPDSMIKALSWRIGISIAIFGLLILSYYMGWMHPHGVTPI